MIDENNKDQPSAAGRLLLSTLLQIIGEKGKIRPKQGRGGSLPEVNFVHVNAT